MAAPSSEGLLRAAEIQLGPAEEPPSEEAIRRAVSTAYYSLFAALCDEIARPWQGRARIAARRLLRHQAARDVCRQLVDRRYVAWLQDNPKCHADLLGFAEHFVGLIRAREAADYSDDFSADGWAAQEAIQAARAGVEHLNRARLAVPEQVSVTCVAMIAGPAERRRMAEWEAARLF
ncbi:MAG: hypothetical protein OXG47_06690 [bacterium]|nr:hypothetical protein [bacterium]